MYSTLIESEQLLENIHQGWIILDCRFNLANVNQGKTSYQAEHLPNAHYLHLDDDLSSPITPTSGRHPLPNISKLEQKLREIGVSNASQIVVYDDCGGAMAARAWWLIQWLGHQNVALLNGGIPAWKQKNFPTTDALPTCTQGNFTAKVNHDEVVKVEQILQPTFSKQIVDARAAERFCGKAEPIDPVAGHIPNALNRPLSDNLENGFFKSPTVLRQEWEKLLGDIPPSEVVHMCGSGVTACHNKLAMEIASLSGSKVYAGSWSEWIRDPSRAVMTC